MNPSRDRRGESLAWLGGLACIAAFAVLFAASLYGQSSSVFAAGLMALGVVGIWIVTGVQLHQQRLLDEERVELAELERDRQERLGGSKTIFDETDIEQMDALAMGRRLRSIEKWFVPIGALSVALYFIYCGVRLMQSPWPFDIVKKAAENKIEHAVLLAFSAGAVSFVTFLLSRSALNLARIREYNLIRAGGNALFGVTLAALAPVLALLATNVLDLVNIERIMATAIGIMMLVLATETVLNFIFDFYRPRIAGVEQRSFYDSRVLGIFSEPGGLLKSLASAVDYQFGFKVSETWFYQLLGRWILPLLLIQAFVGWLLTSITVVPQGYEAVIEQARPGSMTYAVVSPGIHFTAPWPIDRATLVSCERIQQIEIGYSRLAEARQPARAPNEPELWTVKHKVEEYGILVPDRHAVADANDQSLPLNLLSVTMPIQWRVKPGGTERFFRQSIDAKDIVESQAYRVLTTFASSADILDLLSSGGSTAADQIRTELQSALDHGASDGGDLGIEIVHVSLANIHPVTDAADAYEAVVSAYQTKEARIRSAEGFAEQTKVAMGGLKFQKVYDAIVAEEATRKTPPAGAKPDLGAAAARSTVEKLLREEVGGMSRQFVAKAEERAFGRVQSETSRAELFTIQLAAYTIAPNIYKLRTHLRSLERALMGARRYVIAMKDPSRVMIQMDLSPPVPLDLLNSATTGLKAGRE